MQDAAEQETLGHLTAFRATDLRRLGWRSVMASVACKGTVLVTNRGRPEAVILSFDEYTALVTASGTADKGEQLALDELRRKFDERLAVLREPDGADRLRALMREPAKLGGVVKAGELC